MPDEVPFMTIVMELSSSLVSLFFTLPLMAFCCENKGSDKRKKQLMIRNFFIIVIFVGDDKSEATLKIARPNDDLKLV